MVLAVITWIGREHELYSGASPISLVKHCVTFRHDRRLLSHLGFVHNWTTSRWSATKKENRFSFNENGIMSSFLGRQFYLSTLYFKKSFSQIVNFSFYSISLLLSPVSRYSTSDLCFTPIRCGHLHRHDPSPFSNDHAHFNSIFRATVSGELSIKAETKKMSGDLEIRGEEKLFEIIIWYEVSPSNSSYFQADQLNP